MVTTIENLIRDKVVTMVAGGVKLDSKKRLVLSKANVQEGIIYHIYRNRFGQIILDPQVTIPASEAWLFNNPEAIASVRQGLSDAAQGKVSKVDLDAL
ncbi:hypothetical protein ES707_21988 [subsurface metagenome]